MNNIKKQRKEVEELLYKTLDTLDPTEQNSNWYKTKFSKMNDKDFYEFFEQEFPIKFQNKIFEIEPRLDQIFKAAKNINVPIMEKLYMPFLYESSDGKPVKTNYDAIVVYVPMKKEKQFISKKNSMSISIDVRNMKNGRLISKDKNGNTSDREMECLMVMDLPITMREMSTYRADAMKAKNEFYSTITEKNMVSIKDVEVNKTDSIARNTMNMYLLGAGITSNLVMVGNYLPHTVDDKANNRIKREV